MATNYLSGIIDELDPEQKPKNTGFPGSTAGAPIGSGDMGSTIGGQDRTGSPGMELGGGPIADKPAASGPKPWENAKGFLVGFDSAKLNDPNKQAGESGKYTPAAKAFSKITQTYGGGRGDLGQWVNAAKEAGFDAKAVGDDKIDFGDGYGPVDVIRSDGQVVFQNTTGNPVYEQQYRAGTIGHQGGGGGGAQAQAAAGGGGGGGFDSLLSGNAGQSIDAALGKYGNQSDLLQRLIAQLQGG